jgi:hypothetical protein
MSTNFYWQQCAVFLAWWALLRCVTGRHLYDLSRGAVLTRPSWVSTSNLLHLHSCKRPAFMFVPVVCAIAAFDGSLASRLLALAAIAVYHLLESWCVTHIYTRSYAHTYTQFYAHARTRSQSHTHTHTHTNAHAHIHTHTISFSVRPVDTANFLSCITLPRFACPHPGQRCNRRTQSTHTNFKDTPSPNPLPLHIPSQSYASAYAHIHTCKQAVALGIAVHFVFSSGCAKLWYGGGLAWGQSRTMQVRLALAHIVLRLVNNQCLSIPSRTPNHLRPRLRCTWLATAGPRRRPSHRH